MIKYTLLISIIFVNFLCFVPQQIFSQEQGHPYIKNYHPEDLDIEPQIWSIIQDKRGIMYFGTNTCILEFDGVEWRKILLPVKSVIRSFAIDEEGTVYVGGYGEFGYLKEDFSGKMLYHSISSHLDSINKHFGDVWNASIINNEIIFNMRFFLLRYSLKDIKQGNYKYLKKYISKKYFGYSYSINNQFYVFDKNQGMLQMINDSLVLIKGTEKLIRWPSFMLNYNSNSILMGSTNGGLQLFSPFEKKKEFVIRKDFIDKNKLNRIDTIIYKNQNYHGTLIDNKYIAIATLQLGIIIIDKNGNIVTILNKSKGLSTQTIYHLYFDREGILWAGTDYGIIAIEISSPLRIIEQKNHAIGTINCTEYHQNQFYIGTNRGLYALKNSEYIPVEKFSNFDGKEIIDLKSVHIPANLAKNPFLVSTNYGIFEIENKKTTKISGKDPYYLIQSKFDSSSIYFFNNYSFINLRFNGKNWKESDTLASVPFEAKNLCEDKNGNFWVIANEKPYYLKRNQTKWNTLTVNSNNIKFNGVSCSNSNILFYTNNGFYRYNSQKNKFEIDSIFHQTNFNKKTEIIHFKENKKYLAFISKENNRRKAYVYTKQNHKLIPDTFASKRVINPIMFQFAGDTGIWIIQTQDIIYFNKTISKDYILPNQALIRKVIIGTDSVVYNGTQISLDDQPENDKLSFPYKYNDIAFSFSLPSFYNIDENEYSFSLMGNNKHSEWSDWTKSHQKEYTNLKEGRYIFKVKAKNIYGIVSKESGFEFTILPPWYRTITAYIIYVFLIIFAIFFIGRIQNYRLLKDKEKLEKTIEERTGEIRIKNTILEKQKSEISKQSDNLIEINNQLAAKNEEVNQQNEEIRSINENLQAAYEQLSTTNNELSYANEIINRKNKDITSSIQYAKRIQTALFSKPELLKDIFADNFIMYRPKDIVSGDFYWFKKINSNNQDIFLIAVADCTGHGVPGAFMSLLGISFLNEIIKYEHVTSSAQVLDELRNHIKTALNQTGKEYESLDGMDMAFCAINLNTLELDFAGAYNSTYIIRKTEKINYELIELNGDKMPVGQFAKEKKFSSKTLQLKKNDTLYFFTDGYSDQLGYESGTKFKVSNLKKFLLSIQELSLENQSIALELKFNNWKTEKIDQLDDILAIAIKI